MEETTLRNRKDIHNEIERRMNSENSFITQLENCYNTLHFAEQ